MCIRFGLLFRALAWYNTKSTSSMYNCVLQYTRLMLTDPESLGVSASLDHQSYFGKSKKKQV